MRRFLRTIWLRGFAPCVFVLALGLFSIGAWFGGQAPGAHPIRAVIGRGAVMVCWTDAPDESRGIGSGGGWTLGTMIDRTTGAPNASWFYKRPLWSLTGASINWDLQIHPGCIKVPLLPLAVLLAIPPSIAAYVRSRRLQPWQCQSCGYDLSATTGPCPECGARAVNTRGA